MHPAFRKDNGPLIRSAQCVLIVTAPMTRGCAERRFASDQ